MFFLAWYGGWGIIAWHSGRVWIDDDANGNKAYLGCERMLLYLRYILFPLSSWAVGTILNVTLTYLFCFVIVIWRSSGQGYEVCLLCLLKFGKRPGSNDVYCRCARELKLGQKWHFALYFCEVAIELVDIISFWFIVSLRVQVLKVGILEFESV